MNEESAIAWITSLTEKQFSEFFYRAVAGRTVTSNGGTSRHFILADAEHYADKGWLIDFIAEAADRNFVDDAPICQSGSCACGARVRSVAKSARCPVCRQDISCT